MAITAICSLFSTAIFIIWHVAMAEERAKRRRDAQARRPARAVRPVRTRYDPRPPDWLIGATTEKGRQLQREMLHSRQEPRPSPRSIPPRTPQLIRDAEPEDAVPPGFEPRAR